MSVQLGARDDAQRAAFQARSAARRRALAPDRYDRLYASKPRNPDLGFQPTVRSRAAAAPQGAPPSERPRGGLGGYLLGHDERNRRELGQFFHHAVADVRSLSPFGVVGAFNAARAAGPTATVKALGSGLVDEYTGIATHPLRELERHPVLTPLALLGLKGAPRKLAELTPAGREALGASRRAELLRAAQADARRRKEVASRMGQWRRDAALEQHMINRMTDLVAPPGTGPVWQRHLAQLTQRASGPERSALPGETFYPRTGEYLPAEDLLHELAASGGLWRPGNTDWPLWAFPAMLERGGRIGGDRVDPELAAKLLRLRRHLPPDDPRLRPLRP